MSLIMRTGIIFEDGDQTWAPDAKRLREAVATPGGPPSWFYRYVNDNKFARFIGSDSKYDSLFGSSFVKLLKIKRNDEVTRLMLGADIADPLAGQATLPKRPRVELYDGVPEVCKVNIPPAEDVDGFELLVLTSPSKTAPVWVELSTDAVANFRMAISADYNEHITTDAPHASRAKGEELASENGLAIFRYVKNEKTLYVGSYYDGTKWKRVQSSISGAPREDVEFVEVQSRIVKTLLGKCSSKHVADAEEDEDDSRQPESEVARGS